MNKHKCVNFESGAIPTQAYLAENLILRVTAILTTIKLACINCVSVPLLTVKLARHPRNLSLTFEKEIIG